MKTAVLDTRLANCPQWYLIPPKDINMRIPDSTKNCVVFIGTEVEPGKIAWGGTGFFVYINAERIKTLAHIYIVTARHVVTELQGRDSYIRANTRDGKSIVFRLPSNFKWWFHPDEVNACDVAVFPSPIPNEIFKKLDYSSIPIEMFVTDEMILAEGIGIGDAVFTIGLFAFHSGNEKNLPIVRMGNIAMIPDEPVPTNKFGDLEVYLIESRSIGGLSGSPVFVIKEKFLGEWKNYLLGLIHGHWDINPEKMIDVVNTEADSDSRIKAGLNVGIAMITPAKKIIETLNQKELQALREFQEKKWIELNSPTPDMGGKS